ncbi:MAG: hypothetical protein J07HQW2_03669 [Haloquadratum walsbyi J07HQW2]|uniref:Uncharacterized protein n=1 Tax=Haloquadratum walsbyi J07HQW2 TaxID=1238425 RepID=U1NJQ5_9EURY|nr:MAG: hypothetical protein J07HQW2_03669 [Haloquadratum walsbyi J07HQW2]
MRSRTVTATMVGNLPLSTLGIPPAFSSGGGGCQILGDLTRPAMVQLTPFQNRSTIPSE